MYDDPVHGAHNQIDEEARNEESRPVQFIARQHVDRAGAVVVRFDLDRSASEIDPARVANRLFDDVEVDALAPVPTPMSA